MTKDLQGHMDQRDQEEFRALVDLQGIQVQRDFKEIRVSQVLLVLMVLQEPLVLDSKVLRVRGARKEEWELPDRLELVNPDSQVPVVLREHQESGAYQEKDFLDLRVKRDLKDQSAHKDYKACQSKGIRGSQAQWGSQDSLESQGKMGPLERREKLDFQEQEAQKECLGKDSPAPRVMKERKGAKEIKDRGGFQDPKGQRESQVLWAPSECPEPQFLDHLDQRETEEYLACLVLKENLDFLFEDQRVPRVPEDQWGLQDSKVMAILVWLDREDCQDPLDQWAYVVWETLEQRENQESEALQVPLGLGE